MLSKTGANPADHPGDTLDDKKSRECESDHNATQDKHNVCFPIRAITHELNGVEQHNGGAERPYRPLE
ncbi:hypothetical protein T3H00_18680 [Pseudomonas fluorescens]|uniref:hypothetical protein n=1 Tax=Pseudomonas fluorescens TaxID=294 RepID=UPI002ACADC6F|nr:hypothetical protein [Pseudomonas fluorescens]MDZ5434682.1 hypothetical protein [Pseudomonas fluorescens]